MEWEDETEKNESRSVNFNLYEIKELYKIITITIVVDIT